MFTIKVLKYEKDTLLYYKAQTDDETVKRQPCRRNKPGIRNKNTRKTNGKR